MRKFKEAAWGATVDRVIRYTVDATAEATGDGGALFDANAAMDLRNITVDLFTWDATWEATGAATWLEMEKQ